MGEKTLSGVPFELRNLYQRAVDAINRGNFDYALTLLEQVLAQEPAFFEARKALRAAQLGRAKHRSGLLKKITGTALLGKAQLALRKDPLEAIALTERILNDDPTNAYAHRILGEAALAADMPNTAALSLEIAFKQAPTDKTLGLKLADALNRAGRTTDAESVLTGLVKHYPEDLELVQALRDISAQVTISEKGYASFGTGESSFRAAIKDQHEAIILEKEQQVSKTEDSAARLIAEYETRLKSEPENLRLIRALADLYAQQKMYDRALEYYERLRKLEAGTDPALDKTIAEIMAKKFDQQLAELDPAAPDYQQRVNEITAQKLAFLLEDCKKRAERFPTDLQIRFELGTLYFQAGKLNEAIQEFQKAQAHPHKRIQALYYLGCCFTAKGIYDLAVRAFQNALKEKLVFDDEKKELLYALGCALEKWGKPQEAIEQFKLIYEQDIGYKDVAAKIDAYYGSR